MSTLQIELDAPTEARLKEISVQKGEQVPDVASRLLAQAVRTARPAREVREAELLREINEGWSAERWQRYHDLVAKRQAETLTENEYSELATLTNEREVAHARRIERLFELADLRQTSIETVMQELGIKAPGYV